MSPCKCVVRMIFDRQDRIAATLLVQYPGAALLRLLAASCSVHEREQLLEVFAALSIWALFEYSPDRV
jgi:hypothetical protein